MTVHLPIVHTTHHTIHGDFTDGNRTWLAFITAVNHLTGITILTSQRYDFPGGGISGTIILSESHASIHTWPEHNTAWVELATCGDPTALDEFTRRTRNLGTP
jgi:S-adenosylmethionine decarboxylase